MPQRDYREGHGDKVRIKGRVRVREVDELKMERGSKRGVHTGQNNEGIKSRGYVKGSSQG